MKDFTKLETVTLHLLTGLTIVVAIVLAALMAVARPINLAVHWIHKRVTSFPLAHRHL